MSLVIRSYQILKNDVSCVACLVQMILSSPLQPPFSSLNGNKAWNALLHDSSLPQKETETTIITQ